MSAFRGRLRLPVMSVDSPPPGRMGVRSSIFLEAVTFQVTLSISQRLQTKPRSLRGFSLAEKTLGSILLFSLAPWTCVLVLAFVTNRLALQSSRLYLFGGGVFKRGRDV